MYERMQSRMHASTIVDTMTTPTGSHPIGREAELQELRALAEGPQPGLALLTGRRRVGKAFLLRSAWTEEQARFFTAARTSPELNRR